MTSAFGRLAVALVLIAPVAPAHAGQPMETVRAGVERAMKVFENPALTGAGHTAERHRELSAIARGLFDFEEMSRRALGSHWSARTPAERRAFVNVFTKLLETTYFAQIDTYVGGSTLRYEAENIKGDDATVRTIIGSAKGTEIVVNYRLLRQDDRWLIYDVDFEGATLINNYRAQFNKIIRSSSFETLLHQLNQKAMTGSKPAGGT